ncbi:MAG TPA: response regulator, partial [Bacteroidales bacterium]|nr:response regulator [Bacteroidales bacterium]
MNSRKIRSMIVEDEPEALDLLTGLLEATGEATVVASTTNPFEAIDLLLLHTPDILFLDIKMPGMSGFDIINEMNRLTALTP